MCRVDGERRQQRENVGEKIVFEPRLLRLGHIGTVDQHDAGLGECRAQFAPLCLLVFDQEHDGLGDAAKLLGGCQPLGALLGYAGAQLGTKAGHAHHEEFVKVVRRNRKELEPLKQRVSTVGGFLQHAAVEVKPGQLTVDETIRTGGQFGATRRLVRLPGGARFKCNDSGLATVGHDALVLLEGYDRHP